MRKKRREAPLSFENPISPDVGSMITPISQLDVRALELEQIVFEPLPGVSNLTPQGVNVHSKDNDQQKIIPPYSTVYAHDWFGKIRFHCFDLSLT